MGTGSSTYGSYAEQQRVEQEAIEKRRQRQIRKRNAEEKKLQRRAEYNEWAREYRERQLRVVGEGAWWILSGFVEWWKMRREWEKERRRRATIGGLWSDGVAMGRKMK
jgi:hypothetical protein